MAPEGVVCLEKGLGGERGGRRGLTLATSTLVQVNDPFVIGIVVKPRGPFVFDVV